MKEKVLLVIATLDTRKPWSPQDEADEMTELIHSCGGEVVNTIFCKCQPPTASHLITKGKVEEITALCGLGGVDCVIVSQDLKGVQQRNLEEDFAVKTIDRTQLILEIFARNAKSLEGKMQVELAQLQYRLPRLTGHGAEMSRQGGGIGTSGPGETKLEVDRRRIETRIDKLKKDLKLVTQSRQTKRKKRQDQMIPTIALVGYTNAGKSTLLNALTDAATKTHDGLFTTLDSLSRQALLPDHRKIVLTDTVGFMHDLPHGLIEAFKATLEEVEQSDLLLHVMDISNDNYKNFYTAVNEVLKELKAFEKPTILVLNKIDQLEDPQRLKEFKDNHSWIVGVSALKGQNIQSLLLTIEEAVSQRAQEVDVLLDSDRMDLINLAYAQGQVLNVEYTPQGIQLKAILPDKAAGLVCKEDIRQKKTPPLKRLTKR
ncbi:MAG: GTPase HflX [Candidatus Omnitrophica bacterium]|nr:GTPase HflX [Candidatus Omnitrophota bacterium]